MLQVRTAQATLELEVAQLNSSVEEAEAENLALKLELANTVAGAQEPQPFGPHASSTKFRVEQIRGAFVRSPETGSPNFVGDLNMSSRA